MAKLGRQFEEDDTSWWDSPGDAPLSPIPERSQRIIEASRPASASYGHPQDALHDQKLFDAKVSKHGEDPAKLQSSIQRGRPYREEKRVREQMDLEQSWEYMSDAERAEAQQRGGIDYESRSSGQHEGRRRGVSRGVAYGLAGLAFAGSLLPNGTPRGRTPISKVSR